MNEFWSRPTCVILTGASKGIGQGLAVEISRLLIPESTIVLIARDTNGLEKTKEMVNNENSDIFVEVYKTNFIFISNYLSKSMFNIFSIIVLIYINPMQQCLRKLSSLSILQSMNYLY